MKGNLLLVTLMLMGTVVMGALCVRKVPARAPVVTVRDSGIFRYVRYDEEKQSLILKFGSGYVYEYRCVPPDCAYRLLNTSSKGYCYNRYIRGQYAFRRLVDFPR
jgi:hypothetical protein